MLEQQRKLAAIMFTDLAGYTESMSYDEHTAIQAVKKKRSIIQPLIKEHNGVFVKEIGDGTLSYFSSAVDASNCAINLQEMTYNEDHLNIRVGLHIGDIVFDGEDVFGEGVNIASRLESLSPIGGVCVSKNVYDELENKKEFNGESLGLQTLKGVGRLVEVYALKGDKLKSPDKSLYKETEVEKHTDDEVPSIAIIPFENKGAPEDVFYAYGISSELISTVTSAGLIRVASLKDIEKLDYQHLENSEISKKLFIRYIAQGTLWKLGEMFQLSIELYDTKESKIVWSDHWQENWDNLPNIKSNLSDGLLKALDTKPKVENKNETVNPEAYKLYLKAKHLYSNRKSIEDVETVKGLLKKANQIEENLLEVTLLLGDLHRDLGENKQAMDILNSLLEKAKKQEIINIQIDCLESIAHIYKNEGKLNKALEYFKNAGGIANSTDNEYLKIACLAGIGTVYRNKQNYPQALEYLKKALQIAERTENRKSIGVILTNIGNVYHSIGDNHSSISHLNKALEIARESENKLQIAICLNNISNNYNDFGYYEKALIHLLESLKYAEELGVKIGIGYCLNNIGNTKWRMGEYKLALEYYNKSLKIAESIDDKISILRNLIAICNCYYNQENLELFLENLEKYKKNQKETGLKTKILQFTIYLNIYNKSIGNKIDKQKIDNLINDTENIDFETNFRLFELLDEDIYLDTAYKQVQEKADAMEEDIKEKFLGYPIPRQIVDEWEKVVPNSH